MKDDLGDRMKEYEGAFAKRRLDPLCPTIARIDGRNFSKFTKGFQKPFDKIITDAMDGTCKALVKSTNAAIGYVQSDEITLIWPEQDDPQSSMFFDWREQKLVSVLASMAAAEFNWFMIEGMTLDAKPHLRVKLQMQRPHFDARVWSVPDRDEAANTLLWRAQDARRNAITSFCQQYVSHKALQGLNQREMLNAAYDNAAPDINSVLSVDDLYGRYFQRRVVQKTLSDEEWEAIPPAHRPSRMETVTRTVIQNLDSMGYLGDMAHEARKNLIFYGG